MPSTRAVVAAGLAVVLGFVAVDWLVVHPHVWDNAPALGYWIAKPFYVGLPLLGVAWALTERGVSLPTALAVGGVAGIVALQLYYTVVPVPLVGGGQLEFGLFANLTQGLVIHYGALALALAGVLVTLVVYRRSNG